MGISIRDIAKLAGVSPTTVSFVINNKKGVSEETRERVKRIIKENGYSERKSIIRSRSNRRVCIVKYSVDKSSIMDNNELDSYIISSLHSICAEKRLDVLMTVCNAENFKQIMLGLIKERNNSIALIGTLLGEEQIRWLNSLDLTDISIVVIDNQMENALVSSVGASDREIGHAAVRYLKQQGFESIGYLHSAQPISKCRMRMRGFYEEMERNGLKPGVAVPLRSTLMGAYEDMAAWINRGFPQPKAFFVDTGVMAVGAMRAIQEKGIRIPEDISIIAGDDMLLGMFTSPLLTAISTSYESICRICVRLLEDKSILEESRGAVEHISVAGKLLVRNSTNQCAEGKL